MKSLNFKAIAKRFVNEVLVNGDAVKTGVMQARIQLKTVKDAWATCRVTGADGLSMDILVSGEYRSSMVRLTRRELRRLGWGGRHGRYAGN